MSKYTFKGVTDVTLYEQLSLLGKLDEDGVRQCIEAMDISDVITITPNKWCNRYYGHHRLAMLRELGITSPIRAGITLRDYEGGMYRALIFSFGVMKKDELLRGHGLPILEHFIANETPVSLRLHLRTGYIDFDMTMVDTTLEEDIRIFELLKQKVKEKNTMCVRVNLDEIGLEGVIHIKENAPRLRATRRQLKKAVIEWLNIMIENTQKEMEEQEE